MSDAHVCTEHLYYVGTYYGEGRTYTVYACSLCYAQYGNNGVGEYFRLGGRDA